MKMIQIKTDSIVLQNIDQSILKHESAKSKGKLLPLDWAVFNCPFCMGTFYDYIKRNNLYECRSCGARIVMIPGKRETK